MMIPPKLQHGDNLQNLFEKFNAVIDYLREIRLVAGNGIRINRMTAGTTIESTATGGAPSAPAGEEYNGYFKIVDISTGSEKKIMVVDGDTWNAETKTSGPSICRVNGSVYQVNAWTSAAITGRFYVVLQYHADGTNEGVKIRLLQAIPPDRMTIKFCQIGEVYLQDGALKIIQRHTGGEITLTGGLSSAAFGISPIFAEPPETGVFPETAYTIRVNAGTVRIGTSSVNIARQDFTSLSATGNNYIYLTVTYSNGYSASLGCYTSAPSPGVPNWLCLIGTCTAANVYQSVSGNVTVTGVWV